jgi:hypothetical protein
MNKIYLPATMIAISTLASSLCAWDALADDKPAATNQDAKEKSAMVIRSAEEIPYANYDSLRGRRWLTYDTSLPILQEAQRLEKEGLRKQALDMYQDAYKETPFWRVQVDLAYAQARAGQYLSAARNLQDAILFTDDAHPLHTREEIHAVYHFVQKHVGAIHLSVNVPDVRITVDSEWVRDWPYHGVIFVTPDDKHEIKAVKTGYWVQRAYVNVKAGEVKDLKIAMQERVLSQLVAFERPMHVSLNRYAAVDPEAQTGKTWPRNLMIASGVAMGLGVGGLAGGLVLVNSAKEDSARTVATGVAFTGGMLLGLGVTGLVIGIASRPDPAPPMVQITPQVVRNQHGNTTGAGVTVSGTLP